MTYTVHRRPPRIVRRKPGAKRRPSRLDPYATVPEGAARWAFVFGTGWLLFHRLWGEALVFALATSLLGTLATRLAGPSPEAALLVLPLLLLPRIWLTLEGPDMRRRKLERGGWEPLGAHPGETPDEAIVRALAPTLPDAPEPPREVAPASAYRGRGGGTFGLVPAR